MVGAAFTQWGSQRAAAGMPPSWLLINELLGETRMIRYLSVAALIAVGASVAYAQAPTGAAAITERKAAMKAVGGANKGLTEMAKGDVAFDAAKAAAGFKILEDSFTKAKALFPDDSKTGGETQALPAVWEKKADFVAKLDKAIADAKAAGAASKDDASFKAQHKQVVSNCGGCHKEYRQPPKQ
jgi:cytochrome c556